MLHMPSPGALLGNCARLLFRQAVSKLHLMAQEVEESDDMKCIVFGFVTSIIVLNSTALLACTQCRPGVESGVYNRDFAANLSVLVLPSPFFCNRHRNSFSDAIVTTLRKDKEAQQ
jgi:hypothetical protein